MRQSLMELNKEIQNFCSTSLHKFWVFHYLLKVCWALIKRGIKHDLSKYSKMERQGFIKAGLLRNLEYGSDEYKRQIKEILGPSLGHHYKYNSHHPEHYDGTLNRMGYLDILEMLADWKAAGKRHKTGSMVNSLSINSDRFKIDDLRFGILCRDCKEIGLVDFNAEWRKKVINEKSNFT